MTTNIFSHIPYQDLSANNDGETDRTGQANPPEYRSVPIPESNLNGPWVNPRAMFNNRFMNSVFHSVRNQSYEVYVMYGLIILVLIIMIMMTVDSIYDYDQNVINLRRAEIHRR